MTTKLQKVSEVAKNIQSQITKDKEEWKKYLKSAAKLYKYPFNDQILIYAQRPDATAVAPIQFWNQKMHCWVNKGSKGIALIEKRKEGAYGLKYVFDISDVHERETYVKKPIPWQLEHTYHDDINNTLINKFNLKSEDSLEDNIINISEKIAENYCNNYEHDFLEELRTSLSFYELDDMNAKVIFRDVLSSSIAYTVLERCALKSDLYEDRFTLESIVYFDSIRSLAQLGTASTNLSKTILTQIERTVKECKKDIDKNVNNRYNTLKRESESGYVNNEGSNKNESDIQTDGRFHDSTDGSRQSGRNENNRTIWQNEREIPYGGKGSQVQWHDAEWGIDTTSNRNRQSSQREIGNNNETDNEVSRGNGRNEGSRSDGMASGGEQHKSTGRRNSDQRDDIYLEIEKYESNQLSMFPTFEQQKDAIDIEENISQSKYSYINPKIEKDIPEGYIVAVLKEGSGFERGKSRIYKFYQENISSQERTKLIKREYGIGGAGWPIDDYGLHGYDSFNGKGLRLQWKDTEGEKEGYVSWRNVEKEISKLILQGEYLSEKESVAKQKVSIELDDIQTNNYEEQLIEKEEKIDVPETVKDEINLQIESNTNFVITDDAIGTGSAKVKFNNNISAINTLKLIEKEKRKATSEEQQILGKYVGWGGLSNAFDENNKSWAEEHNMLLEVLNPEEYNAARESTLNAFYTQPKIVKAMYETIKEMGYRKGNILEPSMGVGNFFGVIPEELKESRLFGVELDSLSGRIAMQLYQKADIKICGFEKSEFKDNFFDVVIGNVPFGQYKIYDKKYDKHNFLVHDYFFAKALDLVRPGGIVAFITSKGTMDKANSSVRKYIAQRAELIGAIRLPNNAFSENAGTSVTSDILFLQKRERIIDLELDWVHLDQTEDGLTINSYFVQNPDMVLGKLELKSTQYGKDDVTCTPYENGNLEIQLYEAMRNIRGEITNNELNVSNNYTDDLIPADPNVRNYSYCLLDEEIYFRENSTMRKIEMSETSSSRVKGMIEIRDVARELIELQVNDYSDEIVKQKQLELNEVYDSYIKKYGLLNSRANNLAFNEDSSYPLLASLEILDEKGALIKKADMFTKRTIGSNKPIEFVDTASEALAVSLSEKARVDTSYMSELTSMSSDEIVDKLKGVIFKLPNSNQDKDTYVTADEYLSGNIRKKLSEAKFAYESSEGDIKQEYSLNIKALEDVLPKDLEASEIDVRLGATWLPEDIVNAFIYELMDANNYVKSKIKAKYSNITNEWVLTNKSADSTSVKAVSIYGTRRINAYRIIEQSLNLKDVRVMDLIEQDGKEKRVLNKKETTIAQQKQEVIKNAFGEWIWKEPERRERLTRIYNDRFNSVRPREYDGKHINFTNMNPEITLNEHQVNAVARILYGGNTLLAHVVGAGKTFEMVAAAQESKRLGLCNKSLFVVPNHLTEQWGNEYLKLYPSANILVTTKKDFEKSKRKRFCSRIATGEYDAVIIGHSQFEKIPMSKERQVSRLNKQLNEIVEGIEETKRNNGDNLTVKQLERVRKTIQVKLDKLHDTKKDDIVNFEELGIDRIFVDEAHYFKNLFLYTKMRNVAGISQTEANKSSDLFMKCRYLDEITESKGVIFATGTPISNSMTEMYTMQRYLQYETLEEYGLQHFDSWASTFGETITAIELAPEGSGYRSKTRFAKFFNLPELMTMFKEVADIKTSDMLNLDVPEAEFETIVLKPSDYQQQFLETLSARAGIVRNRMIEPNEDNMLKITNDGRKLALDQRLIDDNLPDFEGNKTTACVNKVFELWEANKEEKLTQLIFCDISTPHFDGSFNVYDDIKEKLIEKGIEEKEIQFIHSAKTDKQKDDLFSKVRSGNVRVLIGSTQKMGAGTNVQDKLVAIHDLDCPWRPSDLEQRMGRIVRRGNKNEKVYIYRYVTENTFDSYLYQLVENKQKFIGQIMTSKSPVRSAEDIDEATLSYAEIKALATGNPLIKEKMDLEISVSRLKVLRSAYLNNKYALEDAVIKKYPKSIKLTEEEIEKIKIDIATVKGNKSKEFASMLLNNVTYTEKEAAGKALLECMQKQHGPEKTKIGKYKGFNLYLGYDAWNGTWEVTLKGELSYKIHIGRDVYGNITRLDNAVAGIPKQLEKFEEELINFKKQLQTAKEELTKPFTQEQEFKEKTERLAELDILLNLDDKGKELEDTVDTFDVSKLQDGSVMAVLKKSDKDDTKYVLEISGEGEMQDFDEKAPWSEENSYIYELIVNEGITTIGANSCRDLKIQEVQLPGSIMTIGNNAFDCCFDLETANLGNGIKRIKEAAFNCCSSIHSVNECDNLLCIENLAFNSCRSLEDINYGTNCKVDEDAFTNCNKLQQNMKTRLFDITKFKNRVTSDFKLER